MPRFKSEKEERDFWSKHSPLDYMDVVAISPHKSLFPNLKPSTRKISLRLPEAIIDHAKTEANKRDIPYQSLLKQLIFDGLHPAERQKRATQNG